MTLKKRAVHDHQKLKRRSRILETAYQIFLKKGYERMGMDEVAKKSGLAKGTVYLYFRSKEELLLTLKEEEYHAWFGEMENLLKDSPPPLSDEKRIDWFVDQLCKSLKNRQPLVRMIASLHHLLERNIDEQTILEFNHKISASLMHIGQLIENAMPFIPKGKGIKTLLYIKALVIGLDHVTEPVPVIKKTFGEKSDFQIFEMDFTQELESALKTLMKGFLYRSSGRP